MRNSYSLRSAGRSIFGTTIHARQASRLANPCVALTGCLSLSPLSEVPLSPISLLTTALSSPASSASNLEIQIVINMIEATPMNATSLLLQTRTSSNDSSVSPKPRWSKGVPPTCENTEPNKPSSTTRVATAASCDDEPSPNTTKLLLESHTSTDGHISPKPRWTRGNPNTNAYGDKLGDSSSSCFSTAATVASSDEGGEEPAPSPPSLRPGGRSSNAASSSGGDHKSYMAWRWLLEDEGASEPRLQRPTEDEPVALPRLEDAERELLCRNVELRLLEVSVTAVDSAAVSAPVLSISCITVVIGFECCQIFVSRRTDFSLLQYYSSTPAPPSYKTCPTNLPRGRSLVRLVVTAVSKDWLQHGIAAHAEEREVHAWYFRVRQHQFFRKLYCTLH